MPAVASAAPRGVLSCPTYPEIRLSLFSARKVAEFQSGNDKLIGWFVGQVMQCTKGRANPQMVNQLLRVKLKQG